MISYLLAGNAFRKIRSLVLVVLASIMVGCGGGECPSESAAPYVWFAAPVEGNPAQIWVQFRARYVSSCSYNFWGDLTAINYSDSRKLRRNSANSEANYSVSGRTVTQANFYRDVNGVLLQLNTSLVANSAVNVTVQNLYDESNAIQSNTPKTFSVAYRTGSGSDMVYAENYQLASGNSFGSYINAGFVNNVDYNWGSGTVGSSGRSDSVAVRWTSYVDLPSVGNYEFQTRADDGVRFKAIDMSTSNWMIDDWSTGSASDNTSPAFYLPSGYAGFRVPVQMDYFESSGSAEARLRWKIPGSSSYVAIPGNRYHPGMAPQASLPASSLLFSEVTTSASVCTGATMKIAVRNEDGDVISDYTGTIDLVTSSLHGNWEAISPSAGSINDGASADDGRASYTFSAADQGIATLRLNNRHADQLTVTATVSGSASATATSSSIVFVKNAFEIVPVASWGEDYVAGRSHDLEIQQMTATASSNCEINTSYAGAKALRFWYANEEGTWSAPGVGGVTLGTSRPASTTHTLTFVSGRATVSLLASNAGKYTLNVVDDSSYRTGNAVNEISGTKAGIRVRPFGLSVRVGASASSLQSARTTTLGVAQAAFVKGGETFTIRVEGVAWQLADDSNADGIPDGHNDDIPGNNANLTNNAVTTSMTGIVTLSRGYFQSGGAGTALTSVSGITAASWSAGAADATAYVDDVGEIEINAESTFLGASVSGRSGYVGRFIADSFSIATVPGYGTLAHGHGACNYTYRGESFGYLLPPRITVTAKTARNTTAASYAGNYWKLSSVTAADVAISEVSGASLTRTAPVSPYTFSDVSAGSGTLALSGDTFVVPKRNAVFTQNDGDEVLSTNIQLVIPKEAFTETAGAGDVACYRASGATCQPYTVTGITGTDIRDGCLQLTSASTTGRNPVTLPLAVVHFSGGRYITNTDENASCLTLPSPSASNYSGDVTLSNVQSVVAATLSAGAASVTATLSASAPSNPVGAIDVTIDAPSYLECRDTGAAAQDPVANANWQSGVTNPVLRVQESWR